jgi:uroporphyrinogen-III decarboxylase
MMTSRERLLTAINHKTPDHVPMLCWCFGLAVPPHLRWQREGRDIPHWYTMRLEHIHTLPEPWGVEDDFERVLRWFSLGLDDALDVSPPWGVHPDVRIRDWKEEPTAAEPYTVLCRAYETPAGTLTHKVRRTDEEIGPGWVVQPDHVPLIEDFNIPRGVKHAVAGPEDLPKLRYLLRDPGTGQATAYRERMEKVCRFAREQGVLVQGWSGFGLDLAAWLCGVDPMLMMAMSEPEQFEELIAIIDGFDEQRTRMMLEIGGVDMVVRRGWYSSTDFWSPALFRRFLLPGLKKLVTLAHEAGARFAYTMTTGALPMADVLLESGIDLLYYIDPAVDKSDLSVVKRKFGGRIALAGGVSSALTLAPGSRDDIRGAVHTAVSALGPDNFILAPVDALFPDTPWASLEVMIAAWREVR